MSQSRIKTCILALCLMLSIPTFFNAYYNVDEISNAVYARLILHGDLSLKDYLGNTYLLTHYFYVFILGLTSAVTLLPVHIVFAFWKLAIVIMLFKTGKYLQDESTGLWAALFYVVGSFGFMSKDFHTPSAEALSLLPASVAVLCFFRAIDQKKSAVFFLVGLFAGCATLFKAPMGVILVALVLSLVFLGERIIQNFLYLIFGFITALIFPVFLVLPLGSGFSHVLVSLKEIQTVYIAHYSEPFLYWASKFFVRTSVVALSLVALTILASHAVRNLFFIRRLQPTLWIKLQFLFIWAFLLWCTAALGERVFWHYFAFLPLPIGLLASVGLQQFDQKICSNQSDEKSRAYQIVGFIRKYIFIFLAMPVVGFGVEGALNYSTRKVMPISLDKIQNHIGQTTQPEDRIYVWGYIPQIYFYANRLPATTYIWSHHLAGMQPGSPAMEFISVTGQSLDIQEKIVKDFEAYSFQRHGDIQAIAYKNTLSEVSESELLTVGELLDRIENPYWKKVMGDFLKHPPVVFIDTSPTNHRGFGYHPVSKFELLKRMILDNYKYETRIDDMIVYRLKKSS